MAGVHLVVLQHGLWGYPAHLGNLEATLRSALEGKGPVVVVNCAANAGVLTYDGIDTCGDRVVALVRQLAQVRARPTPTGAAQPPPLPHARRSRPARPCAAQEHQAAKLSLVGYSLGGLINRYAAGRWAGQHPARGPRELCGPCGAGCSSLQPAARPGGARALSTQRPACPCLHQRSASPGARPACARAHPPTHPARLLPHCPCCQAGSGGFL
jgi:hypothetical protein